MKFLCRLIVLLQLMANWSYLKSQKLKVTESDRQKVTLLQAENAALKKDKAALEQRIRMLKEVIQKNRGDLLICVLRLFLFGCTGAYVLPVVAADGAENPQKELQEVRAVAQTLVESAGFVDESGASLADRLQKVPQKFAEYLAETSRNCLAQALGLVKSYWPRAKIGVFGDGMCWTSDHDQLVCRGGGTCGRPDCKADRSVECTVSSLCHVNVTFWSMSW